MMINTEFTLPDNPDSLDLLIMADWCADQGVDTTELRRLLLGGVQPKRSDRDEGPYYCWTQDTNSIYTQEIRCGLPDELWKVMEPNPDTKQINPAYWKYYNTAGQAWMAVAGAYIKYSRGK